jgi:uridine kinase
MVVNTMEEVRKPMVIAIASISGGGKTTVVEKLNEKLTNSKVLFFYDYDLEGPEILRIVRRVELAHYYHPLTCISSFFFLQEG